MTAAHPDDEVLAPRGTRLLWAVDLAVVYSMFGGLGAVAMLTVGLPDVVAPAVVAACAACGVARVLAVRVRARPASLFVRNPWWTYRLR